MILELAEIQIRDGEQAAFEAAILHGVRSVLAPSPGFMGWRVRKGIESPRRYLLEIEWRSLEDHTVGFRGSDAFPRWRAIVGPFFDGAPRVEHFALVGEGGPA